MQVSEVNQLVDRFFEARKMMAMMAGRWACRELAAGNNKKAKGKKGKKGGRGPTQPKMRGGFPDRRRMPGLPPGMRPVEHAARVSISCRPAWRAIDLSQLKFPKN